MDPGGRVNALEQQVWTVCSHRFSRNSAPDLALPVGEIDSPPTVNDATQGPAFLGVPAKAPAAFWPGKAVPSFRAVGRPMAPAPTSLGTRVQPAQTPTIDDGSTSRFGVDVGPHRRRSGEISGTFIGSAFGLQGAHAESADEFDALLDDVQSAGLSGLSARRSSKPGNVGQMWRWKGTLVV